MTKIALSLLVGAMLAAGPAAAQEAGGGGLPASMPRGAPGDAPAPGNVGQLERLHDTEKFAFDRSGAPEAAKFEARARAFLAQSSDTRDAVMALGRAARAGEPIEAGAAEIRKALEADLQDWRETFSIPRKDFRSIHEQMIPREGDLTPAEWAVRRAQWYEARDKWIEDRRASLGISTGG